MGTPVLIGVDIDGEGAHPAAWRAAAGPPADLHTAARIARRAELVEDSGFHIATFADSDGVDQRSPNVVGRLDPIASAAFAAAHTDRIGLVPLANAIHAEPFHLSNQFSSLDWATRGRAGWLVTADSSVARARAFGTAPVVGDERRQREASDVVDAARRLWDSWEDGAIIADESTGRFLDHTKVHYVDFSGEHFAIKGPALLPRPPQGQVVVFAAPGTVRDGLADVLVVSGPTEPDLLTAARSVRTTAAARVFADIEVALDTPERSARERVDGLDRATPWQPARRLRLIGSPDELVSLVRRLAGHVDGIRLLPAVLDVDVPTIARAVIPALRAAGVLDAIRPSTTLRELLALPRPIGRYDKKAS